MIPINKNAVIILIVIKILISVGCLTTTSPTEEVIFQPIVQLSTNEEPLHTSPVFLPGTQPRDILNIMSSPGVCKGCHGNYGAYSPYDTWKGSMMSFAAIDPLFLALNSISNRDLEGVVEVGDYCLRCHTPAAWLEGRSEPVDGSDLTEKDLEIGVSCDFCHRMVDPLTAEGRILSRPDTTTHANGQYVVSPIYERRGPYDDADAPHHTRYSDFHTKSEICATCHDIYNPVYDLQTPVETTYSEWKYSDYAREGIECQDCHMPKVEGYAAYDGIPKFRDNVYKHEMVGGSSWMPEVLIWMRNKGYVSFEEDRVQALEKTKKLALDMLKSAAELQVSQEGGLLRVKLTNLAGHKLPTGYPEGRRMWFNIRFYDDSGNVVGESGAYNSDTGVLKKDKELKVYEAKPGMKDVDGYANGPSFHFALNNYIYKDNRIPPRGFSNAKFEERMAYIRGAEYADGQNWDLTEYTIPKGTSSAVVRLRYQSASREFVEFLRDENKGNPWDVFKAGERIYEAWEATGRSPPVDMVSEEIEFS